MDTNCVDLGAFERHTQAHFEPLDKARSEIRLITVTPPSDSSHGLIECSLSNCSLDENPRYWALSYVWGDGAKTAMILLDGRLLFVTPNLRDALGQLCHTTGSSKALWADAICINQENDEEKSWQVLLMGRVFANAYLVHVWLGNEDDELAKRAMMLVQLAWTWYKEMGKLMTSGRRFDMVSYVELWEYCFAEGIFNAEQAVQASRHISYLLQKAPYWRRSWTLQELCLARGGFLWCGTARLHTAHLYDFDQCQKLVRQHLPHRRPENMRHGIWELLNDLSHAQTSMEPLLITRVHSEAAKASSEAEFVWCKFTEILLSKASRQATDPRDHIYSILGLANPGIEVDYKISVDRLFTDVYARLYREVGSHASYVHPLLSFTGRCLQSGDYALPSWVADWDALASKAPASLPLMVMERNFTANSGLGELAHASFRVSGEQLRCSGVVVDEVTEVWDASEWQLFCDPASADKKGNGLDLIHSVLRFLIGRRERILSEIIVPKVPYVSGVPLILAVLRTFCIGRNMVYPDERDPWRIQTPDDKSFHEFARTFSAMFLDEKESHLAFELSNNLANFAKAADETGSDSREVQLEAALETYQRQPIPEDMSCLDAVFGLGNASPSRNDILRVLGFWPDMRSVNSISWRSPFGHEPKSMCAFHTKKGYIGAAKRGVARGDVVCVLADSTNPFVLRRVGEGHHELMSACYVDGVMDGEVVGMVKQGRLKIEELRIL